MDTVIKAYLKRGLQSQDLYISNDQFFQWFTEDGVFLQAETDTWDFKKDWPFSYSDEYFVHIAKLVCAFANTSGGLIIFNVNDSSRKCANSLVAVNTDKFLQAITNILDDKPKIEHRKFALNDTEKFDILIVYPRAENALPVGFRNDRKNSPKDLFWVRIGHETVAATSKHIPILFCRSEVGVSEGSGLVESALPPAPMQIKRFVGRLETIYKVFEWLLNDDYPRTFLYGRGGSGKTTIAYEVAKHLVEFGGNLVIGGRKKIDSIIFISAKEKRLDTITGRVESHTGTDFTNSKEMLVSILVLGGWADYDYLIGLTEKLLNEEAKEFFDTQTSIIFIDDVDTITTKGADAGIENLYLLLARSRAGSRVIYTLRNVPSHSLSNAIEVPGLAEDGEYQNFVETCSKQFSVPIPPTEFIEGPLKLRSERRPLIVELIIALRRGAGSYERALELFELHAGDEAREYVFRREWDSLPNDNRARLLLAALALLKRPVGQNDLETILQYGPALVADAITNAREMFIEVVESQGESTYKLSEFTQSFVESVSEKLDFIAVLKTRISAYEHEALVDNPDISRLRSKVGQLMRMQTLADNSAQIRQAWILLTNSDLKAEVKEDPRYKILLGRVAMSKEPLDIQIVRDAFEYAVKFDLFPEVADIRNWYLLEESLGGDAAYCARVVEIVEEGSIYSERTKIEYQVKKASRYYSLGKECRFLDHERAVRHLKESLLIHLHALKRAADSDHPRLFKYEEYARNTAFLLFNALKAAGDTDSIISLIITLAGKGNIVLDVLEQPVNEYLIDGRVREFELKSVAKQRFVGRLGALKKKLESSSNWESSNVKKAVLHRMSTLLEQLTF